MDIPKHIDHFRKEFWFLEGFNKPANRTTMAGKLKSMSQIKQRKHTINYLFENFGHRLNIVGKKCDAQIITDVPH